MKHHFSFQHPDYAEKFLIEIDRNERGEYSIQVKKAVGNNSYADLSFPEFYGIFQCLVTREYYTVVKNNRGQELGAREISAGHIISSRPPIFAKYTLNTVSYDIGRLGPRALEDYDGWRVRIIKLSSANTGALEAKGIGFLQSLNELILQKLDDGYGDETSCLQALAWTLRTYLGCDPVIPMNHVNDQPISNHPNFVRSESSQEDEIPSAQNELSSPKEPERAQPPVSPACEIGMFSKTGCSSSFSSTKATRGEKRRKDDDTARCCIVA